MIIVKVTLNMGNPNALYTVGMLSALLEKGGQDYTDLIAPFVLCSLPETIDEKIDLSKIQDTIKLRFGFEDIPIDFIKGVLQRYTKPHGMSQPYVRRYRNDYYLSCAYPKGEFDNKQAHMRQIIDNVLTSMQDYYVEHFIHKRLTISDIRNMLIAFFESLGFSMARDINSLKMVTVSTYGKENFWVARYVLDTYESKSIQYDYLTEITKGFLTYKALYFFEKENKISISSKLKNVTFYLDCSLIINCLGYDSDERKQETKELINLIRRNGGKVCVFEHTVEEATNLLSTFAKTPNRRNSFRLSALSEKDYSTEILEAIASSVSDNLYEQERIETVHSPNYTLNNYTGVQDEKAIIDWLKNARTGGNKNSPKRLINEEKYEYDARSLSSIGMIRRNFHPTKIEHCKAVMVTQDPWLNRCMKAVCPNTFPPEVDFALIDIDLASLLWLSNYNIKSSLPADMLIASATAACQLSQEAMDRAIEITDQLVANDDLSERAALVIRSQPSIRHKLFDLTENDVEAITPATIKLAVDEFVRTEAAQFICEAENNAKKEVQQKLDAKDLEIQRLNKQLKLIGDRQLEKEERRNRAVERATNKAERIARIFERVAVALFIAIMIATLIIGGAKVFWDYSIPVRVTWSTLFVVLDILSLAQIVSYFRGVDGIIKGLSSRIRDLVFMYCYDKEIGKISEY